MDDHKTYCMMHPDNERFRNCFSACNCDEKTLAYISTHPAVVELSAQLAAVTAERDRLRESIEDVERLHAEHRADCTVKDGTYDYCDEEMAESRHHAATCALAHAVYMLTNSREERERKRREVLAQIGE
jgi:hypothetical protein